MEMDDGPKGGRHIDGLDGSGQIRPSSFVTNIKKKKKLTLAQKQTQETKTKKTKRKNIRIPPCNFSRLLLPQLNDYVSSHDSRLCFLTQLTILSPPLTTISVASLT